MLPVAAELPLVVLGALPGGDLATLPPVARGAAASAAVLLLGAGLRWRRPGVVERAVAESADRPLSSLGYGAAAHAVIAFGGVYLLTQLTQVRAAGWNGGVVGAAAGASMLLLAGALGFTVAGSVVAGLAGRGGGWDGVVVGAAIAGLVATAAPLVGAVVWFVVVSAGIGGPVRAWVHASAGPDR